MQNLVLNKDKIFCNPNDYQTVHHQEYFNLKIIPKIGELEREIGLLNDLAKIIQNPNLLYIGDKYSSFYALNCQESFNSINIYNKDEDEEIYIQKNIKNIKNIFLLNNLFINENTIIKIYEKGYSALDLINLIENNLIYIDEDRKHEILIAFEKIRKEFRNEKILLFFIINFVWLDSKFNLENMTFI